jgi:hypothetical protein
MKANNGFRRDAATTDAAKYERLYSNVYNSSRAHIKAYVVATTNLTVQASYHLGKKNLDMTSRQVSLLPAMDVVITKFYCQT